MLTGENTRLLADLWAILDHVILVSGVDVRACASAAATCAALRSVDDAVSSTVGAVSTAASRAHLSVIVRGPGPVAHDALDIAEFLGLPLTAEVLWEPRLQRDIEDGRLPGSRARGQVAVGVDHVVAALRQPTAVARMSRRRAS
jgi:hypothetical protein